MSSRYCVNEARTLAELVEKTNALLEIGAQLVGGVAVSYVEDYGESFYQAMLLPSPPEPPRPMTIFSGKL